MRENVDHHDICNRATVFDINGNAYQLTIGGFSSPGAYIRSVESTIGKESYSMLTELQRDFFLGIAKTAAGLGPASGRRGRQ